MIRTSTPRSVFLSLGLVFASAPFSRTASAQDTRVVTEPKYPPACSIIPVTLDWNGNLSESQNTKLSTAAIQSALDKCSAGHAVVLRAHDGHNAILTGALSLRVGVTLLIEKGVHLVASNRPSDYERTPGSCGITDAKGGGCYPLIRADHAHGSAIMGEGIIEGRGDLPMANSPMSWWQMHDQVKGDVHHNIPWLIGTDETNNFTLYRITLHNAPNFNVFLQGGDGITVWGIRIDEPWNSPNTDGIDPSGSTNVTVTQSYIRNGDDGIAIKAPAGKPARHITVSHDHFYEGHGMSIGSGTEGGVSDVLFTDLTIDHQKSGLHIKSNPGRGGLVNNVRYEDVCIRDTTMPVLFETTYIDANAPKSGWINGTKLPVFRNITLHNVASTGGARLVLSGMDTQHRTQVLFDGVDIEGADSMKQNVEHSEITIGPGSSNWIPKGSETTVTGKTGAHVTRFSCTNKFVPFPLP